MPAINRKPRRTNRAQYRQLVSAIGAQILRHALEARRQRLDARTSPFTGAWARDAARRERLAARWACEALRDQLVPADFRAAFRGMRSIYRQRLAAEREAEALVAQTRMGQLLQRESALLRRAA